MCVCAAFKASEKNMDVAIQCHVIYSAVSFHTVRNSPPPLTELHPQMTCDTSSNWKTAETCILQFLPSAKGILPRQLGGFHQKPQTNIKISSDSPVIYFDIYAEIKFSAAVIFKGVLYWSSSTILTGYHCIWMVRGSTYSSRW